MIKNLLMTTTKTDILIIGGGPTGSTAATALVRKGFQVQVIEKAKFPRPHVGESLVPFCYQLLEELDILEEVKAMAFPKPGVRFIDDKGKKYSTYCFANVIEGPEKMSFHVDRAKFDKILLDNARTKGAKVLEEATAKAVSFERDKVVVDVALKNGNTQIFEAKFLLDASGQNTFLAKKLRSRRKFENMDRTAFYGHWHIENPMEELKEGIQQIVSFEDENKGWVWIIPIEKGRLSVGVVLNNTTIKAWKKNNSKEDWMRNIYLDTLHKSKPCMEALDYAIAPKMVNTTGNYSYYSDVKYGERFCMIGDAGAFIDPIFSTGIFLGMKGALLVAGALEKLLKQGDTNALKVVYKDINGAYVLIKKLIDNFYSTSFNFYDAEGHFQNNDSALRLLHFMLSGNFFEKQATYNLFFEKLKNPVFFKRYQQMASKNHHNSVFVRRTCKEATI